MRLYSFGIALPPILSVGSQYLKDKVARDVITGKKIMSLAVTEPYAGSDVANLRTTARKEGKQIEIVSTFLTLGFRQLLRRQRREEVHYVGHEGAILYRCRAYWWCRCVGSVYLFSVGSLTLHTVRHGRRFAAARRARHAWRFYSPPEDTGLAHLGHCLHHP